MVRTDDKVIADGRIGRQEVRRRKKLSIRDCSKELSWPALRGAPRIAGLPRDEGEPWQTPSGKQTGR